MKNYIKLERKIEEIFKINNSINILYWDMSINTPKFSLEGRKEEILTLKKVSHELLISQEIEDRIKLSELENKSLNKWQLANLKLIKKRHLLSKCVDPKTQSIHDNNTIECESVWHKIKLKNDYDVVKPYLKKVIHSTREVAKAKMQYNAKNSTYDILVDQYDPQKTISELKPIYQGIKKQLIDLIRQVIDKQKSQSILCITHKLSNQDQLHLNNRISMAMGFDFNRGRIDVGAHYFCGGAPQDTRLLVKDNSNLLENITKVIHEVGHGLYEQNLPINYKNQPVGKAAGMAAHESQALIMEMHVGRSKEFITFLAKILRDEYGLRGNAYSADNLYKHITRVQPNLIRLDSDELTYLLHIIMRCEIEEGLIEGNISVNELPKVWKEKMRDYFDIEPDSNSNGCLQDIHWFRGYFGYFPSYCRGTMLALILMNELQQKHKLIYENIENGDFDYMNLWMNKKIRNLGSLYTIDQLVLEKTMHNSLVGNYINYVKNKYL